MQALDFLLPQPHFESTPEIGMAFNALIDLIPDSGFIDYQLPYPKWQFLSYLCQSRELVLHGSQHTNLKLVEPRKAMDVRDFSNQEAIYATTDGIWVIYFAILDRKNIKPLTLFNSCLCIRTSPGALIGPLYFFSITHSALIQKPWCDGVVYILSREYFEQEPAKQVMGSEIIFPHWVSTRSSSPIAKLHVGPQDFPYLDLIHGHNDEKLTQLAASDPDGFPWPDALET